MKKPWIGIDMGHKIYKVEKLDTQENYSQKVKIEGNLVPKLEKRGGNTFYDSENSIFYYFGNN
ncbi:hypothetical protein [Bacillus thuringiensis]|uniref:hypothetical protein n=1 Tax=Bacillus thuringiensis TaxID=1428 RepID=UPI003DA027E4